MVLSNVDDLTLWASCREVCTFFRAEAERELSNKRLKKLAIQWDGDSEESLSSVAILYFKKAKICPLESIDGDRATFSVQTVLGAYLDDNRGMLDNPVDMPGYIAWYREAISSSDRCIAARIDLSHG